jgi:competence protein ComEC
MATGAGWYFLAAPVAQAPLWTGLSLLACTLCAVALRYGPGVRFSRVRGALSVILAFAACFAAGALAAHWRVHSVAAPRIVDQGPEPVALSGWVWALESGHRQARLIVRVSEIEGVSEPPHLVSIATPAHGAYRPGQAVRCIAQLQPPAGPIAPHSYDSARAAFFERVGASGFTRGACRPAELAPPRSIWDRTALWVAAVRRDLAESIHDANPGSGGAVAAALITGDISLVSRETLEWYRNSGLGHLLSVSGLHMSLVAGGIYAVFHFALALLPGIALRAPIRKWAAIAGLIAGSLYLILSGASVPAQRAYIMAAIAFGAILVDRPAITMRGLALAMAIIVLMSPEAVFQPGFQMSFAATAALVAAFERGGAAGQPTARNLGWLIGALQASGGFLAGMALASLVAGLATDAIALAHFQRLTSYGLISNLVATPILTFVVTPAALLALLLAPFGLADIALTVMSAALSVVNDVARVFADRPEAITMLTPAPRIFLPLVLVALCWATIWRGPLRLAALAPALMAIAAFAMEKPVLLAADGDLRVIVARDGAARRMHAPSRGGDFLKERIGQLTGLRPSQTAALAAPSCAQGACVWTPNQGPAFVLVQEAKGYAFACQRAIVLAKVPPPHDFTARCRPIALIDPQDRAQHGGVLVRGDARGFTIQRAQERPARVWSGALTRSDE